MPLSKEVKDGLEHSVRRTANKLYAGDIAAMASDPMCSSPPEIIDAILEATPPGQHASNIATNLIENRKEAEQYIAGIFGFM